MSERMSPREYGATRTLAWSARTQDERRSAVDQLCAELERARASEDAKDKEIERLKARCRAWRIQWATVAREHRNAESTAKQDLERMEDVYADLRELCRAMAYGLDTSEIKRRSTDGLITDLYRNCDYRVHAHKIDTELCSSRLDTLQAKVAELERVCDGEAIARRQEARLLTEARAEIRRQAEQHALNVKHLEEKVYALTDALVQADILKPRVLVLGADVPLRDVDFCRSGGDKNNAR